MKSKVWYITGASKGLGVSLVKKLLSKGYRVAATSRDIEALETAIGKKADSFLPLAVTLTDEESVRKSIGDTLQHFGSIDVIVNNAGYGMIGALEELTDAEARANFDVNVFGSLNVIRQAMPHLREQKSGHIFNIASIGGFSGGFPGFGIYCATKFAVHGLTESLAHEIKDFGLFATVVMPGYFRTSFLSSGSLSTPNNEIAAYASVRATQTTHTDQYNGQQAGDPDKAADVMIEVAALSQPPIHLFLGADAYGIAGMKMDQVKNDMKALQHSAANTDVEGQV